MSNFGELGGQQTLCVSYNLNVKVVLAFVFIDHKVILSDIEM